METTETEQQRWWGVVRQFDRAKGFGFITRQDGETVFVHYTALRRSGYRSLNQFDAVEFDTMETCKGLKADNVVVVD